jgi:hypothetical protein
MYPNFFGDNQEVIAFKYEIFSFRLVDIIKNACVLTCIYCHTYYVLPTLNRRSL